MTRLQKFLPHHAISHFAGWLANMRIPFLKNMMIRVFMRIFGVDLKDVLNTDINYYATFNEFFTRFLRPDSRPIDSDPAAIVCPVDGCISELGEIHSLSLLQAKGKNYRLVDLLGGDQTLTKQFEGGRFITTYLAPKDYHRVHMPVAGTLRQMVYAPGCLFCVDPASVNEIPGLFTRNERVIAVFDTTWGSMAMILVGAMTVGKIVTVWHGPVKSQHKKPVIERWDYTDTAIVDLQKGQEMGHFMIGSTVIVLLTEGAIRWNENLQPGSAVQMGERVGQVISLRSAPSDLSPPCHLVE